MYLVFDLAAPLAGAYWTNTRMKNKILMHWPRKTVDDVEVFDKLYYYNGSVIDDNAHRQLYALFGTSVAQFQSADYSGVDKAWIALEWLGTPGQDASVSDAIGYVNANSVLNETYTIDMRYTRTVKNVSSALTSAELESLVLSGHEAVEPDTGTKLYFSTNGGIEYEHADYPLGFMAIMDSSNVLFDRTARVLSRSVNRVSNRSNVKYAVEANIRFEFTRKIDPADPAVDAFLSMVAAYASDRYRSLYTISNTKQKQPVVIANFTFDKNMLTFAQYSMNFADDGLSYKGDVTVAGFTSLKKKQLPEFMRKAVKSDYSETGDDGWSMFLTFVVFVIAMIVAAYSGGTSLVAFLKAFSYTLTVSTLILSAAAYAFQRNGYTGYAMIIGRAVVTLMPILTVVSFILMLSGLVSAITAIKESAQKIAAEAAAETSAQVGTEALTDAATNTVMSSTLETLATVAPEQVAPSFSDYATAIIEKVSVGTGSLFTELSTTELLTKAMNALNTAFNIYAKYIAPVESPGTPPEEVPPDNVDTPELVQADFDSYMFLELNERMDSMPDALTQGLIDNTFNKYYHGAA